VSTRDREELNMETQFFRHMSRRALLETLLAAGSIPLLQAFTNGLEDRPNEISYHRNPTFQPPGY
jgi:hypothetical protein